MKKALDLFRRVEYILLVIPMAVLIISIFVNILLRAFFESGLSWLEEFSRYVFVFSTFLGASIAVETDQHPKMSAVIDLAPKKVSLTLQVIGSLFCAVLSLVVAYYGYQQVVRMISTGAMASALPIPMWVVYLIIPLAMLVSGIRYLCLLAIKVKNLFGKKNVSDDSAVEGGNA